jgi:hypothetical protein
LGVYVSHCEISLGNYLQWGSLCFCVIFRDYFIASCFSPWRCGTACLILHNAGFVSISSVTQVRFYNKINVEEKYISIIRQGDLISNLQHNILKFGLNHTQICPTTSAKHGLHGCEWFFIKHVKHDTPKWYVCNVGWTETAMAGGEHSESACGVSAVSSKSVECVHRGRSLRS